MLFASSPSEIAEYMKIHFNPEAEELWVLCLNSRGLVKSKKMIFRGTVDMCLSHPRDIFRFVIIENASAFILVHNHPSGDSTPSEQDLKLTNRILRISKLMEITLLDHIVLGKDNFTSFKTLGYFNGNRWNHRIKRAHS